MQHKQAKLSDILGHKVPCMFSKTGNGDHPFRYEPCRSQCNGLDTLCPAYIPSHNGQHEKSEAKSLVGQSKKVSTNGADTSYSQQDNSIKNSTALKPADTYVPMMVRRTRYSKILPRNYQDWIRRLNDGGVI